MLRRTANVYAEAEAVADFQSAYARLSTGTYELLITNLKLQANVEGLQLAYVAASGGYPTRTLVYSDPPALWIVRELQRTGAFFERRVRVPFALPSYVRRKLPVLDRRNPIVPDRRAVGFRGGRRASDVPLVLSRL